ncbi:hypothetical protein FIBSPDRAFT_530721 [Athelia psychrophila]|uniref:RlpA-like protein double-psi beta-barrel domain-containing protein n=1 Tax=Athelia psychrophila TaxID=1759441 RepID=A0A166JHA2_9AGAM|nr:hypothetical protein FIBSPDRAFT_530721 [Fibularhizoctonia sp. CBS 109695]
MRISTGLSFLSVAASLVSAEHLAVKNHHSGPLRSARSTESNSFLAERDGGSRFTFYADGLGACGKTNKPSDFIVALNSAQFAGGAHCFEMITITVGSKTSQAMIVDECPGCPPKGLDFSEGLFDFFGSESEGVLNGAWDFGGASAPAPTSSAPPPPPISIALKPKPTTSSTPPPPPPTTTWKPETTSTSSWTPPPTSSSTSHSKKHSSSSATPTSTSSSSSSAPPATSASSAAPIVATQGTISTTDSASSSIFSFTNAFMSLSGLLMDAQLI